MKRNLLNVDEILRIPSTKLLVNLRGNKPLILDKVIYTEHKSAKELKESPIGEYNPKWVKNSIDNSINKIEKGKNKNNQSSSEKINWNNF